MHTCIHRGGFLGLHETIILSTAALPTSDETLLVLMRHLVRSRLGPVVRLRWRVQLCGIATARGQQRL